MARFTVAALVTLVLLACTSKEEPARERLTLERFERVQQSTFGMPERQRPAAGNVFVIVHLVEDPGREERRDWIKSSLEDWDGRTYKPRYTGMSTGQSEKGGLFGRKIKVVDPDRIQLVFEVPQTAVPRTVTLPHPVSLSEKPVRISDPRALPKVVHRVNPDFPEAARYHGAELVKLEVLVNPDGTVAGARLIHGSALLGDPAAAAVRQWKYEPPVVDGKPVSALIEEHIHFRGLP